MLTVKFPFGYELFKYVILNAYCIVEYNMYFLMCLLMLFLMEPAVPLNLYMHVLYMTVSP